MDNKIDDLTKELEKLDEMIDNVDGYDFGDCAIQIEKVLKRLADRLNDKTESQEENDEVVVNGKTLEDALNDLEDFCDVKKEWGDESTVASRRDWFKKERAKRMLVKPKRPARRDTIELHKKINRHRDLERIKIKLDTDKMELLNLLNEGIYKDIEELRWFCVDTNMYRKRFDPKNSWFIDGIDDTMGNLERSGRDYIELIDGLISYINDLIAKIDIGEIK